MAKIKKKKGGKKKEEEMKKEETILVSKVYFYTKERWDNWIGIVKESNFKIEDQDKCTVFVSMIDDVILACLKIIAKYDKGILSKEDAEKHLADIKQIVLKKVDPINDDTDIMLESTQISLVSVFASCELYINKSFEKTNSFGKFIESALQAEEKNDMENALNNVAIIGANVISGEQLTDSDFDKISQGGIVAEWLDGIDSITAAMIGDTSYKEDEPDMGD